MKHHSLFAALLTLACIPAYAQEEENSVPEVERAEEALEEAEGEEVLETPQPEEADAAARPQARDEDAPLQFTYEEFMEADQDGNGILSIEEANAALPDAGFEDANGDSWLNHAEAEAALAGLDISIEGAATYSVVGESDFIQILRAVEEEVEGEIVAQQG